MKTKIVIPEDILQQHCVQWFRMQYPKRLIFHVPNGGKRNYLEAVKFKRMGVTPGIPDLIIPEPIGSCHGLFVELKSKKGKLSLIQLEVHKKLYERDYQVEVCNEFEQFQKVVKEYFDEN